MIKHTPGPWVSDNSYPHNVYHYTEGIDPVICDMYDSDFIPIHERQHNSTLIALAPTAPHECDDPKCPGNVNRRKLELYEEMRAVIRQFKDGKGGSNLREQGISRYKAASNILAKAEAIEKGE